VDDGGLRVGMAVEVDAADVDDVVGKGAGRENATNALTTMMPNITAISTMAETGLNASQIEFKALTQLYLCR
jgi:hypothetical protein